MFDVREARLIRFNRDVSWSFGKTAQCPNADCIATFDINLHKIGDAVFSYRIRKINGIDFNTVTRRSKSGITLCPVGVNRSPYSHVAILVKPNCPFASPHGVRVDDRTFNDCQLPIFEKFLKSFPATTY